MGDRALVVFRSADKTIVSPTVYLHWSGHAVPELIEKLAVLMNDRRDDVPYACARFIGLCHEHIPGNLSLGVSETPLDVYETDSYSHGDAGVVVVDASTFKWKAHGGYLAKKRKTA